MFLCLCQHLVVDSLGLSFSEDPIVVLLSVVSISLRWSFIHAFACPRCSYAHPSPFVQDSRRTTHRLRQLNITKERRPRDYNTASFLSDCSSMKTRVFAGLRPNQTLDDITPLDLCQTTPHRLAPLFLPLLHQTTYTKLSPPRCPSRTTLLPNLPLAPSSLGNHSSSMMSSQATIRRSLSAAGSSYTRRARRISNVRTQIHISRLTSMC